MKNKKNDIAVVKSSPKCPKCGSTGKVFKLSLEWICDCCAEESGRSFEAVIKEWCLNCGQFIHEVDPMEELLDLFNLELEKVEVKNE